MPMIRYQIRNEYGLADPELYGAVERDDPEALLEGVAMAGLVGVLRQLGDLAEFAAEIFHDLHEEVMATAARGHGLKLRVQQLEAEVPSIEKTFFSQTNNSSFACNDGIDWHANIQMDQNLITQGDMPRFILDSYEECRGPPRLFMLDKFDVAGAGACLKRYSDPSFFKMDLPPSGMLETEFPREKKARKIKKGSQWKNAQTLESLLAPHADSNLQPITSDQVSEKTSRRARLKSRNLNGMNRNNERSLMEHLLEIHSSEQKVLLGSSISHYHIKINPIDSNESAPEIHEIVVDASAGHPLVRDPNPIQSPIKKEVIGLLSYELESQKIKNEELSGALHDSFGELKGTVSDSLVVEQKEISTESGYKSEDGVDGYVSGEPEKGPPALQVVNQNRLLGDAECKTEGGADGYRSDDFSSELDNFVDALNSMESDLETDSECRAKADPDVIDMESHGKDSDTNKAQQELQAQFSEPDSVDNSAKSWSSSNMFQNEMASISDSDASSLPVAKPAQRNLVPFDLPANSEICLGKTYGKATETDSEEMAKAVWGVFNMESHGKDTDKNAAQSELQAQFSELDSVDKSTKLLSLNDTVKIEVTSVSDSDTTASSIVAQPIQKNMDSIDLPANSEICSGKTHDRTAEELWQNKEAMKLNSLGHFTSSSFVTDSTKILVSVDPQGSNHESQSINGDQNDLPSGYEASDANETTKYLDGFSLESGHLETPHPAEHVEELISEDTAETFDMPDLPSQIEDRSTSREAPAGYIEDSLLLSTASMVGESQESMESDTRACSDVGKLPTISSFAHGINPITSQLDGLATELKNGLQPEDIDADRSSGFLEDNRDIAEEFNGSSPGSKDDGVPENIHPSDFSVELNPEDVAVAKIEMTNHHSQTSDECILEKVPTGFGEDSTLPSTGNIGEPQESVKQDAGVCLGGSTSLAIPTVSPDISLTVQPEGLAAEMEKVVACDEPQESVKQDAQVRLGGSTSIGHIGEPQESMKQDAEVCLDGSTSIGHIGEPQESVKQDAEVCLGGSTSLAIPALSPDISFTVQPEGSAAVMEKAVACSEPQESMKQDAEVCLGGSTSTGHIGELQESVKQDAEVCLGGSTSLAIPALSPDISFTVQPEGSAAVMEKIVVCSELQESVKQDAEVCLGGSTSTGHIGEPQESVKQDAEVCLGGSTSLTIPALSPDISFTVQPESSAAEMEKVVACSEHVACSCSTVGLENAEETAEGNISIPNTVSPELEYSDSEDPQEFPHVVSAGFTLLCSVEETCPSDMQLQCNVPNDELIECSIPADNNLKLLDEPTEHISQENSLQRGGPILCDDIVSENANFSDNSYNANPFPTYSPETSGLLVEPQENSITDDAFLYQHQVENQKAISPKDMLAVDYQSLQYMTHPSSGEDELLSAPTASDPELSILDSSDPSDSRLLGDVCQTKLSGDVPDLHYHNEEINSVYSLESKQDFGLKALLQGDCEAAEEKPPNIHFHSEPTIPLEGAVSKSQAVGEPNEFSVLQEDEHLDLGIPTSSIDLNDEPSEQGPEQRSHDSARNGDISESDVLPLNKAMCGQVEPETSVSLACSSELIQSSLSSNVSAVTLPTYTGFDVANLESSSQLPFERRSDEPVSSFPLQDVEEPPPLPPLPPLEWRKGKLQLGSLLPGGNLFQPLGGTNSPMASSAADWKHGHGLLANEGEMVNQANPFVTVPVLEAQSSWHGLLKSEGEKMHPFRLSELSLGAGDEKYHHDAPFLEGEIVHPSSHFSVVPAVEDKKHLYSCNALEEVMLQLSNPFTSLSYLEDEISQHPTQLHGETLQPSKDASSQMDQSLPSLELERSQETGHGCLSSERETVHPPNPFMVGSDIEDEKHQFGYGICGGEHIQLLQPSVQLPTTGPELPDLGCITAREYDQPSQFDVSPAPDDEFDVSPASDDENLNTKPCSIRSRPRDPLIEAVAAHDRSTMRKVSEMVLPSNKPEADERDSLLAQIRNKSFNLKPAVITKPNIKGPPTNLKVAAIIEKANAIRQAFVGSDEDDDEDGWSDS